MKLKHTTTDSVFSICLRCLCCCHRDEAGVLSGEEASCNHGGVGVAKRSDSPNTFLDQESRRREEEEPAYCTTPTYGTLLHPGDDDLFILFIRAVFALLELPN